MFDSLNTYKSNILKFQEDISTLIWLLCNVLFGCLGPLKSFVTFRQWVGYEYDVSKFILYECVESLKCE